MTQVTTREQLIETIKHLDWVLRVGFYRIRTKDGCVCPIIAAYRQVKGKYDADYGNLQFNAAGKALGMPLSLIRDIADAADGLLPKGTDQLAEELGAERIPY